MNTGLSALCRAAAGPPTATIVLLHGIQGTAITWREVMHHLPLDLAVVAPNLRGRAQSFAPDDLANYRIEDFREDVSGMVELLATPLWLCGWSMGVLVALAHAAKAPRSLAGLILASGTARPTPGVQWFTSESQDAIAVEAMTRAITLGLTETASAKAVAGAWLSARRADFTSTLARIHVPTLIMHGTDDTECPLAHGRALADGIPGARFNVWIGGGHNLMQQDPRRFAQTIAHFIRDAGERWPHGSRQRDKWNAPLLMAKISP